MAKKWPFDVPQWFKDAHADLRAGRAAGDVPASEFLEHAADEIDKRHASGDPFGRALWIWFAGLLDADVSTRQRDADAELRDLERANGFITVPLISDEELARFGLKSTVDLGWDKKIPTETIDYDLNEKVIKELERKQKSWKKSLQKEIDAHEALRPILAADKSKKLYQVIADPEDYGRNAGAL